MLYPHSEFDSEQDAMLWAEFLLEEGAAQVQVVEHNVSGAFYVTGSNTLDDVMPEYYSWGRIVRSMAVGGSAFVMLEAS